MRKSRFTDSQIMAILKQAEAGLSVPELCREHGISSATFYKWRFKYGGMDTSMMKRLKELEDMPADMFPDRPWGPGDNPKTAVWEYLKTHPEFEIDKSIQHKLLITVAPDGYLKRNTLGLVDRG